MTTSSSSSREPTAESREPSAISPLRSAVWLALAVVLAIGVVMYFRHQGAVTPLLGGSAEATSR